MTASDGARWYADAFLKEIPRVLTLADRDPTSSTFGCLDRNYWHYRTQDFPSGMYQELALPLAQAFVWNVDGNPWRGEPRIREIALAAIRFSARSAHADASCDDYYPFERALGATAFVAAAHAEAMLILDERDPSLLAFLARRAHWLADRDESGRLTNHHALVALAAARISRLCGDATLRAAAQARLERCLAWQHAEGWFPEYEGADPGYQSLTIAFLAALRQELPSPALDGALVRACEFLAPFLHPDGSLGGEVGSRNTCQVLPSGFERLAATVPAARHLADGWLRGARAGRRGYPDDDRIFCHWMADYRGAFEASVLRRSDETQHWAPPPGTRSFPAAGLDVVRDGPLHLVVATSKGGALRAFTGDRRLHSDTGVILIGGGGTRYVMHGVDHSTTPERSPHSIAVAGRFQTSKRKLATPMKQVAFRIVNATLGRFFPDLLRRLLQRVLITGRNEAPFRFSRRISWTSAGELTVDDEITADAGAPAIVQVRASTDATSIYVATSNLWQSASLESWTEHPSVAEELRTRGIARLTRHFRPGPDLSA